MRTKKANFNVLYIIIPAVMVFVLWGLFQSFGADITDDVRGDLLEDRAGCNATEQINCSTAYNISTSALEAQDTLSEKSDQTAKVVIAGIIITILVGVFGAYLMKR